MAQGDGGTALIAAAYFPMAFLTALVLGRGFVAEVRPIRKARKVGGNDWLLFRAA